jgi:tetratricopeptide (TPR) repeat protein
VTFSSFIQSNISNSNFERSNLQFTRFDGARISSTKFNNAFLSHTVFDGAQLCDVDFSDANMVDASVFDVRFDDRTAPQFARSNWWMAAGWSNHQFELLTKQSSNKNYLELQVFKQQIDQAENMIKSAPSNSVGLANGLNQKAWTLATYGDPNAAEPIAQESLKLLEKLKMKGSEDFANVQDTLAYILMEKADRSTAEDMLREATSATKRKPAWFRYGLVLYINGKKEAAADKFRYVGNGYYPSHELYELRNQIPDSFLRDFAAAGGLSTTDRPPIACPTAKTN